MTSYRGTKEGLLAAEPRGAPAAKVTTPLDRYRANPVNLEVQNPLGGSSSPFSFEERFLTPRNTTRW